MGRARRGKIKRWVVARFCTYHRDCTYEFLVSCLHTAEPKSMILTIRFEAETKPPFSGLMSRWTTALASGQSGQHESHTRILRGMSDEREPEEGGSPFDRLGR